MNRTAASRVIATAYNVVSSQRSETHGEGDSFTAIAQMWSTYLSSTNKMAVTILPSDVCQMMVLLKMMRAAFASSQDVDHFVDQAGYSGLAAALLGLDVPQAGGTQLEPGYDPRASFKTGAISANKPADRRSFEEIEKERKAKEAEWTAAKKAENAVADALGVKV